MLDTEGSALTPASGTLTAGASAQLIGLNTERNGITVDVDSAAAASVYLLFGTGTASATNFHICLPAGAMWDGQISSVLWTGPVQFFSTAGGKVGVAEL